MKILSSHAWRGATNGLRASLSPDELVRQTLARHGLAPGLNAGRPETQRPTPSSQADVGRGKLKNPDGALFLEDHFSNASGSRRYLTYIPASARVGASGLVVMLHGCTQTPEDFATGTRMNELAEKHGFIVVYPHQSRGENAQSCWNWFRRADQGRDRGEPAILAGLTQRIASEHNVPARRTFVAGLSAGAAMAVILGETYPDVFAGVGAHSGLPAGSAKDVASAFAAMAGNGTVIPVGLGGVPMRTIVVHGTADGTVNASNGKLIADRALERGSREMLQTVQHGRAEGRSYSRTVTGGDECQAFVEYWEIDGLGHAWSGGSPAGSYTDPHGPDASTAMVNFFFGITKPEA